MKPADLKNPALMTAKAMLLQPFGLHQGDLSRALGTIASHRMDDADLYFQYSHAESWALEEGIVKIGNFSIDQGVGVRAVQGEKTAFAYSDDISRASLQEAARTVRAIGAAGQSRRTGIRDTRLLRARKLYAAEDPVQSLDSQAKIELLDKVETLARARDPRVSQVMASLASVHEVVLIARMDGGMAADVRPLVRLSVTVVAEHKGRRELGSFGGGGRFGLAYFDDALIADYVDRAVSAALVNLESRPTPAGEMSVVLRSGCRVVARSCHRPARSRRAPPRACPCGR